MLIKYAFVLFVNTFFMFATTVRAEINNHIFGNNENKIIKKIDTFFAEHPKEKRVIWHPVINAKSRYALSIPKDGYLLSKKYLDLSDLYYLSDKIDKGLNLQPKKLKYIDAIISNNNSKLVFNKSFLSNLNIGFFFQQEKQKSFGLALDKNFIISNNVLSNFGIDQTIGENTVLNAKFVKLFNSEDSEFYGNLNYELKSDIYNVEIGHNWFEIADQYDLTVGFQEQDKKLEAELYATFGAEKMKFQIGFNQIKSNSSMNMFINLKLKNIINNRNFGSNVIITSKESIFGIKKLSLKSFRKKNLDILWNKYMNYN
jgi:hypothetical protein